MEFSGLFRIVRRLPIVFSPVLLDRIRGRCTSRSSRAHGVPSKRRFLAFAGVTSKPGGASAGYINLGIALVATLLLAGCGSSGGISSISSTVSVLSDPRGLAVDSSRNLYIADSGHHEISEVTRSTGLLTVIAGTGLPGYSGDGGAATSAQLSFPQGVALDSSGNIYIADTGNNCIRKIASNGVISTIVGVGAQLKGPQAVALDSSGNLYIADTGNNVIRKVVLSTGVITTVAGNGTQCNPAISAPCGDGGPATSATLNTPADVKVDSSGNLYIADQSNFVIREVSGGNIATVAGSYVSGGGCQSLITTCDNGGPATSALLNNPQAVAVDSSGNIYIADTGNNVVRKVSGGTISTVVGNGTAGYSGDGHSATGAELNSPNGLIFDSSGTLYIDDAGNKVVRKISF
jgi:sugar lactone lactonase YvrE